MPTAQLPGFTVLGAGSWGTALAMQLARNGVPVTLWGRSPERLKAYEAAGENSDYLPGQTFPDALRLEPDLGRALSNDKVTLLACPSHAFAELLQLARPHMGDSCGLAWASKGFEPGSGRLLHQVAEEALGPARPLAVLTGPSFALEVARGLPTAVTIAANDPGFKEMMAHAFHDDAFRVYTSTDLVGAEFGGAAKNVYAIAAGIADGMELGANARAALITRGLHEMMALGLALGAHQETLVGLSGLGDLILTCTANQSRNHRFGQALGQGIESESALADIHQVVEGIPATRELCRLAEQHGVEAPIAWQVLRILEHGVSPQDGLHALMARHRQAEGR